MKTEDIHRLFENNPDKNQLAFDGICQDCKQPVLVIISLTEKGFKIESGAVFQRGDNYYIKCEKCYEKNPMFTQECEVYTRIVGYLRPTKNWNNGQKAMFHNRKMANIGGI